MKKYCFVLCVFIGLVSGSRNSFAEDRLFVSPDGVDIGNDCQNADSPCGTVVYAIAQASDGDRLELAPGVYTENEIVLDKNLTIQGHGSDKTILQAAERVEEATHRVILINQGIEATIEDVAIQHGKGSFDGGGISNAGILLLNRIIVRRNTTGLGDLGDTPRSGDGAGIYNNGELIIRESVIEDNFTGGFSLGVSICSSGRGAGLFNDFIANAKLLDCTIRANRTSVGHEGGHGGGLFNQRRANMDITNSLISGNKTGDTANENVSFLRGVGGGIYTSGTLTIDNSTISGNSTGMIRDREAIPLGDVVSDGGAIYNSGDLNISHSTIVNNTARRGGGISNNNQFGTIDLSHTIIANNSSFSSADSVDCLAQINSKGYNLIENTEDCTIEGIEQGNLFGIDPLLGVLRDNGGPTRTHALLPKSPAIDAGSMDKTELSETDQRGFPRIVNDRVDLGAYEVDNKPFIAYNDFSWIEGQQSTNISLYTSNEGDGVPSQGNSGSLIDFESGEMVSATLTVEGGAWNGGSHTSLGTLSNPGTDAYEVFNGIVDATGVLSYGSSDVMLTFEGLSPVLRYELILFGNRDEIRSSYRSRTTKTEILDVAHMENMSSEGAKFNGPTDQATQIRNGYNTENGYLARYTNIDPGFDGSFKVRITDGDLPNLPKHYMNALCLKAFAESGESITQIGLSNFMDGDKDVTEYLHDETLYIMIKDVDLDVSGTVETILTQNGTEVNLTLEYQVDQAAFLGNTELNTFSEGEVNIVISGSTDSGELLRRESKIFITSSSE